MIEFDAVTFAYPGKRPVFQAFTWKAGRGESWAILGPSGCGKSTLLALADGLRFPQAGQVLVDGEPIRRPRPHTGLIIQEYGLLPWATVRENASLGLRVRRFYGPDGTHSPRQTSTAVDVDGWLRRLGLEEIAGQYPGQISGGQRQRTAIARTLALQPDLLLMDEPFSSLDAPTREGLQTLTLELWREQALTLLVVTHAIEEAAVLGQRILLLGQPPNQAPQVIENPLAGTPGHRETPEYAALVRELRARLEAVA